MTEKMLTALWFTALMAGCSSLPQIPPADIAFVNGAIYVGKAKKPWVSAVAVRDGHFTYVGDMVDAHVGADTQVVDLENRMVIPGIIDGHSHPGLVALSKDGVLLEDVSTKEALLNSIRQAVKSVPDRDVVIGGFWPNELFDVEGPHKSLLDEIEAERPVILYDDWGHTVWANTAALERGQVTRNTKDLVPGFSFYQKDLNGEPTGWITESAASVFINHFQTVTPEVESTLLAYLQYYQSVGVTTVLDAGNFGLDREIYQAVSRLDKQGVLPVRYHGAYTLFIPSQWRTAVATLKDLAKEFNTENVRIDTLKIFFDGVLETRTAAMSYDYLDTPGNSGEALLSRDQVRDLILELDGEGLNLHMHAVGDRATTTLLDAVEKAHEALGRRPTSRITLCHLEIVKDSDFARFRNLGVVANFTPHWAIGGDRSWVAQGVGETPASNMQRAQPLINDGAFVTFSSDITDAGEWSGDRANPFLGMEVGHNRQDVGVGPGGPVFPPLSDRLRREDLLLGYTTYAAYQLGRSEELGSIAVGLKADLAVLSANLFEVDRYDIHSIKPVLMMMNGQILYSSIQEILELEE